MAPQKIVYLVTSGEHDDMRPEAIMATPELANAVASKVESPDIIPMPVLDYVPELVTAHQYLLRLDRREGWIMLTGRDGGSFTREEVWDFQAPKISSDIQMEVVRVDSGPAHLIRITHREEAVARQAAEKMLARLRAGGPGASPE